MTSGVVRLALRRAIGEVRYVGVVRPRRASGLVAEVYRQLERDFGMLAPPVALHSVAPPVLAAAWLMLRESLVADGTVSRSDKEVVAASVSEGNACPYCVEVHGMALGALGSPGDAAAIEHGDYAGIAEEDTRALALWARGDGSLPAGVPAEAAAELTAVAVVFHYLNRMVNIFLGPSPLPPAVPDSARPKVRAVLGHFLKPGPAPRAGAALDLLPRSFVDGPSWALPGTAVGEAFARAADAVAGAAEGSVSPGVRDVVVRELKAWDGRPPGLSRSWVDAAVAEVAEADRPAARFALLTVKAAYQIDEPTVADVLSGQTDGRGLVELAAWASLTAATELGGRLHRPAGDERG
ncbi:carboxymuconolactone decarboxylase family protein [Amycolatopsis samaneae]|uniref:carboxymuconolactone decarboxylase family protein n=1 Tax=Amycolatopsis samaneae TaxID=664691 RepID=UPI003616ABAB